MSKAVPAEVAAAHPDKEPVVVNTETQIETNSAVERKPFAGTKVQTNSEVQVASVGVAEIEESKGTGDTVIVTYVGVQPGVVLTDAAGKEIA